MQSILHHHAESICATYKSRPQWRTIVAHLVQLLRIRSIGIRSSAIAFIRDFVLGGSAFVELLIESGAIMACRTTFMPTLSRSLIVPVPRQPC